MRNVELFAHVSSGLPVLNARGASNEPPSGPRWLTEWSYIPPIEVASHFVQTESILAVYVSDEISSDCVQPDHDEALSKLSRPLTIAPPGYGWPVAGFVGPA